LSNRHIMYHQIHFLKHKCKRNSYTYCAISPARIATQSVAGGLPGNIITDVNYINIVYNLHEFWILDEDLPLLLNDIHDRCD
jgi:hypothetical protein